MRSRRPGAGRPLLTDARASAKEECQIPTVGGDIVTQDVHVALTIGHFEVSMVRGQPAIDDFGNLDLDSRKDKPARRLLAAMSSVAVNSHGER
jgi:hypothetical protein